MVELLAKHDVTIAKISQMKKASIIIVWTGDRLLLKQTEAKHQLQNKSVLRFLSWLST